MSTMENKISQFWNLTRIAGILYLVKKKRSLNKAGSLKGTAYQFSNGANHKNNRL